MDKATIKSIHKDLDEAIKAVGEKHNFAMTDGSRISYNDAGFTFKAEVAFTSDNEGKKIDPAQRTFETHCEAHGLSPEDYGKEVRIHGCPGHTYEITGIKPKARKNAVIIKDKKTGTEYVCAPEHLDDTEGKMLMKGFHRCGYCGAAVYGTDDDVLCYECRSMFGHSLFSEL